MKAQDLRVELHRILDGHDQLLVSVQDGQAALQHALTAHDAGLVHVIDANRAALRLLTRLVDEGTEPSSVIRRDEEGGA